MVPNKTEQRCVEISFEISLAAFPWPVQLCKLRYFPFMAKVVCILYVLTCLWKNTEDSKKNIGSAEELKATSCDRKIQLQSFWQSPRVLTPLLRDASPGMCQTKKVPLGMHGKKKIIPSYQDIPALAGKTISTPSFPYSSRSHPIGRVCLPAMSPVQAGSVQLHPGQQSWYLH